MALAATAISLSGTVICRLISHATSAPTTRIRRPVNAMLPRNRRAGASIAPLRMSTHTSHGVALIGAHAPSRSLPSCDLYEMTDGPFKVTGGPGKILERSFHDP